MKIVERNKGKRLQILLEKGDTFDVHNLMGWTKRRGDPWYHVENNLVNQIVLGLYKSDEKVDPSQLSDEVVAGLEHFQIADVAKMVSTDNMLNANPMGLGKTIEEIKTWIYYKIDNGIVIAPKVTLLQWRDQIAKWYPKVATEIIRDNDAIVRPDKFYLVNEERLVDNDQMLTKLKSFRWDVLTADEAHRLKNRKSQRTQQAKQIPAARRHGLTGTPILRYVDDLWSVLHFVDPFYSGGSYHAFKDYFCEIKEGFHGSKIVGLTTNQDHVAILNTLMEIVSVRNEGVETAQGKFVGTVKVPMNVGQQKLYNDARKLAFDQLPPEVTIANGAVLTMRLRQITSWPGLFISNNPGPKFEWILQAAKDNPNEKIVVMSAFEQTIAGLNSFLTQHKIRCRTHTGQNTDRENEASKQNFIHGNCQVLGGTFGSLGTGVDGLQQSCRAMILLERDWSPAMNQQYEERLHRTGQRYPTNITYLECDKSFDAHVGKINVERAQDIRSALNE